MPQKTLGGGDRREQGGETPLQQQHCGRPPGGRPASLSPSPTDRATSVREGRACRGVITACRHATVDPPPSASPGSPSGGAFFWRFALDIQHGSCRVWVRELPHNLACLTNAAISIIRCQTEFAYVPEANRHYGARPQEALDLLLTPPRR